MNFDLNTLVAQISTMAPDARDAAMVTLAQALSQAGAKTGNGDSSGNMEVLQYMTRQPAVLRGHKLLGVKVTKEVAIVHPEEPHRFVNIPASMFDDTIHTKWVFKDAVKPVKPVQLAAPVKPVKPVQADPVKVDGEEEDEDEELDFDGDEEEEEDESEEEESAPEEAGELKPKGKKGKGKRAK